MPDTSAATAVGTALGEIPISGMLAGLGTAIATAQGALDTNSIQVARQLAETKADFVNAEGQALSLSLLDLGFLPTFYQFSEARLELTLSISMGSQESSKVAFGLSLSAGYSSGS
jgi:hypothetical protein